MGVGRLDGGGVVILYVSWGGTGWAASVREAMRQAGSGDRAATSVQAQGEARPRLNYLAILDDAHFADLDDSMLVLVKEELQWLLEAQMELNREQVAADDLTVEVLVRTGDVVDAVAEVVDRYGPAQVLIGAPVDVTGYDSVEGLIGAIRHRTGGSVTVVEPQGWSG
jgi:hypothetical protein